MRALNGPVLKSFKSKRSAPKSKNKIDCTEKSGPSKLLYIYRKCEKCSFLFYDPGNEMKTILLILLYIIKHLLSSISLGIYYVLDVYNDRFFSLFATLINKSGIKNYYEWSQCGMWHTFVHLSKSRCM